MPTEVLLAAVMVGALVLYAIMGGADFGGGVWDLAARGPRRREQRALIEGALGPIWEANHVWLILVTVLLFAAFPPAFAAISIALHVPLTLFLVGVVLRGSAFAFRSYAGGDVHKRRWGRVFSIASLVSPVLLGAVVGALSSGRIRVAGGEVTSGLWAPWLAPYPIAVGLFALCLFAFLAATYLAYEAPSAALQDDFRRRALSSAFAVAALALVVLALSFEGAPRVRIGLTARPWTWPLHAATAIAAITAIGALARRRYGLARLAAATQVGLIVIGWAAAQYPYLVVPDLTLAGTAAHPATRRLLLIAVAIGLVLLAPALVGLYRLFKPPRPALR